MTLDQQIIRSLRQAGIALRNRRKALGLTQGELGRRAGVKQSTISDIENGVVAASLETYLILVTALDSELHLLPRTADPSLTEQRS
jgi:HTH-type transcriptional regulator/antitoxin HipB